MLLHHRQRNKPQLLPAVAHAVDRSRLIELTIDPLKSRDQRQKARAEAHPQNDHNTDRQNVRRILEKLDRRLYQSETDQRTVDQPLRIAAENILPDHIHRPGDRGRIKQHSQKDPLRPRQLIEEPRHSERQQIPAGTGDQCNDQRIFQRRDKHVVVHKQAVIVVKSRKPRHFKAVKISKAQADGYKHRQNRKRQEKESVRQHKHIMDPVPARRAQAVFPVLPYPAHTCHICHRHSGPLLSH